MLLVEIQPTSMLKDDKPLNNKRILLLLCLIGIFDDVWFRDAGNRQKTGGRA